MKIGLPAAILTWLACAPLARTQEPAAPSGNPPNTPPRTHSLGLEVTVEKHGGSSHNADEAQTRRMGFQGPHAQEYGSSRSESLNITLDQAILQVTVRNFGTAPDAVVLESYFFGERAGELPRKGTPLYDEKQSRQFIFDHPAQNLTVPVGAPQVLTVESKELRTITERATAADGHVTSNFRNEASTKLRGWTVRLVAEGRVLAVRASTTTYEELGKDDAKLAAYLALKPPREERNRTIGPFKPGR